MAQRGQDHSSTCNCRRRPRPRAPSSSPAAYELPSLSLLKREVFGPILHVVRFAGDRLAEVCDAINATGYGLTLGLHTRIEIDGRRGAGAGQGRQSCM